MKTNQYRRICIVLIVLVLIAQIHFLVPKAVALSNSEETALLAGAESKHLPVGVSSEEWDQIIQQIDPLVGQAAYLKTASPKQGDHFGYSVDISGDTLVVGAYYTDNLGVNPIVHDSGSAFVFVRAGAQWEKQAELFASNSDPLDMFGWSVAIDGDTIVVGAPGEDSNGTGGEADNSLSSPGAAYVFNRNGTNWAKQAYLKATIPASDDYFGQAVAIDGDTIVVGAYRDDLGGTITNAGAAYVFVWKGAGWIHQAHLKAINADTWDYFGSSVAIDGNQIVVGAWGENSNGTGGPCDNSANDAGAAYFFWRNVSTETWSQKAYLKASNAEMNDYFGRSVSISGDTLVIGADGEDGNGSGGQGDNSLSSAGAVYVFEHIGASWTQKAYLKTDNVDREDTFGRSVFISNNTILVGAPGEASDGTGPGNNDEENSGAAYIFVRNGTGWEQQAYLKAFNAEKDDYFGFSAAMDGHTIVVGAYGEDSDGTAPGNNDEDTAGAAYVFKPFFFYLPLIK